MSKGIYYVSENPKRNGWDVRKEDVSRAVRHANTKTEATKIARELNKKVTKKVKETGRNAITTGLTSQTKNPIRSKGNDVLPVERTINFFRVDAGRDRNGVPIQPDFPLLYRKVNALPFDDKGRYYYEEYKKYCCWVEKNTYPIHIRFGLIRTNDLPSIETNGTVWSLNISADQGLVELIHVVIFRDNIVGFDFNNFGPRIHSLADYLNKKVLSSGDELIVFRPLVRRDVIEQMEQLDYLQKFEIKAHAPYIKELASVDASLFDAFDQCMQNYNAEIFELSFQTKYRAGGMLSRKLMQIAKTLLHMDFEKKQLSRLRVKGVDLLDHQRREINLIDSKVNTKRSIPKLTANSRALDPGLTYRAIEDAYSEMRSVINESYDLAIQEMD